MASVAENKSLVGPDSEAREKDRGSNDHVEVRHCTNRLKLGWVEDLVA